MCSCVYVCVYLCVGLCLCVPVVNEERRFDDRPRSCLCCCYCCY